MARPELILDVRFADLNAKPIRINMVSSVIVRDLYGNEIALARLLPTGHVIASTVDQKDFRSQLNDLGVSSRVEVIRAD